jgi:Tol biopolymer transport system component
LIESSNTKLPLDLSHDGRFLLYIEIAPKTGYDLWALPVVGERKPVLVANTPYEERNGQFSSDGRWVAYQSNESGRFEVYVQPFLGSGDKQQISIAGGEQPRWRADGKELFFLAPDSKLMAVTVQALGGKLDAGSPVALFQTRTPVSSSAIFKAQYAVSRDGRFLMNMPLEDSNAAPITLILNWKPRS